MKLRKAKSQPMRRQRQVESNERLESNLLYHSRRTDQDLNVGREVDRDAKRLNKSRLRRLLGQRVGLLGILIVSLVLLVTVLRVSSNPKVEITGSTAGLLHTKATYQAAASTILRTSLLDHNKITIDTNHLRSAMLSQFPELSDVSLTLPLLGQQPTLYLQANTLAVVIVNPSGAYVLDSGGKVLLTSHNLAALSQLHLPVVTDQSGLALSLNKQALTSDNVQFIQIVVAELAAKQVSVGTMTLPAAASELDVAISGQPYFVKFNLQNNDAAQQAGTYLAVAARLKNQNVTPAKYVDVRVDGRAYYQ